MESSTPYVFLAKRYSYVAAMSASLEFNILDEEYIFILAQMDFYSKVLSEVSGTGAISYTTDALSVTGAKEGYKSVQQQLDTLEQERIRVFHKIMANEQG